MGQYVEIFRDTLIGVIDDLLLLGVIIRLVRQPLPHELFRHPAPPAHLEPLGEVDLVDRQHDKNQRQIGKAPQLRLEHRVVFVLQRIVEHLVPLVDQHADIDQAE